MGIDNIPLDDKATFELFSRGETEGIFQFESSGMKSVLKRFKPETMEDLFLIIALYRPGPMKNIDEVIKRKNGKSYTVLNGLEDILSNTYGIIVYQEQIMQISNVLAGYSLGEADILRRAISKKKSDVLKSEESKFIKRCIENNVEEIEAKRVFDLIYEFASYGFNKAHSVSYSYLSYFEAYLKANYRQHFYCELLNYKANVDEYMKSAKREGVEFLRPRINNIVSNFVVSNNSVLIPVDIIKGVSKNHANIFKEKYDSIFDFVVKTKVDKNVFINLIYAGVFDEFYNRKTLIENIDTILDYADIPLVDPNLVPILEKFDEYDKFELMELEKQVFGFYLEHPVSMYKKDNIIDIKDISDYFNKDINIIGLVDRVNDTVTKKHEKMGFASISDEEASIDLVLFPRVRSEYELNQGDIIIVNGRVERRFEKYQLIVNKIKVLNNKNI